VLVSRKRHFNRYERCWVKQRANSLLLKPKDVLGPSISFSGPIVLTCVDTNFKKLFKMQRKNVPLTAKVKTAKKNNNTLREKSYCIMDKPATLCGH
jgi:hypothetical protein